jgi:hypothetical protein
MSVRAKFRVDSITRHSWNKEAASVELTAVSGDKEDNKSWSEYTPSGSLKMCITNPAAVEQFKLGEEYFLDFTPAKALLALFALAIAAVLFAPAAALAQGAAPTAPGWLAPVLQYIVAPMVPLFGVAVIAAFGALAKWLHGLGEKNRVLSALGVVADVAATVVAKVEAVERPLLPGVLADGKVTAEEGKHLASAALAQIKASLSTDVLGSLGKVVGAAGVDGYLAAKLEQVNAAQSAPPSPT